MLAACGAPDLAPVAASASAPQPSAPAARPCPERRFAVVAGPFEVAETIGRDALVSRWKRGGVAASPATEAALAPILGARPPVPLATPPELDTDHWGVVPIEELSPAWSVVAVDGKHPLEGDDSPLAVRACDAAGFDRSKLTTLVMSGTTALTGATAEHIDQYGIADEVKDIAPFFASADLAHVSNEVAFVEGCKPWTGQQADELKFCSRDRYIEVLAALHVNIIELTGSHLLDYGHHSLERTLDMYEQRGWVWFGGGRTQLEATAPRFVEDHGNRLAFLGCNHVNWWIDRIFTGSGGANCDYARMRWQISDLRRRGYTVIASVQHRELRTHEPDWDLVADLRGLAAAGAAFVQGSQAHTAHPWDVHHGGFVHYGPGNTLFAQYPEFQRDAAIDKLYIYDGQLLTVSRLLVRSEHGRPRRMSGSERRHFLGQMAEAERGIAAPDPWAPVTVMPETRERPDSMVVRGKSQKLTITVPQGFDASAPKHYRLIVDVDRVIDPDDAGLRDAFVVRRKADIRGRWRVATPDEIVAFMKSKYPIDAALVQVGDGDVPASAIAVTAPPRAPVVRAPPVSAALSPVQVTTSKSVNGVRWVRHKHHHELDYQIDANGQRVR